MPVVDDEDEDVTESLAPFNNIQQSLAVLVQVSSLCDLTVRALAYCMCEDCATQFLWLFICGCYDTTVGIFSVICYSIIGLHQ